MTYKNKDDLGLAIEIMLEIGDKVIKLSEEKQISVDEAADIIRETEDYDEELVNFLNSKVDTVMEMIAVQESKNETKH
jgi:PDZ domain-containing secreted protein